MVIQFAAQIKHPAPVGALVGEHAVLFLGAGLFQTAVALGVVDPLGPGGDPATTHAADRAVHIEHLEYLLQA